MVSLTIVPLGGLGRFGANMMVYETSDDMLVVDCGTLFATDSLPGVDFAIPDPSYIVERKDKLRGYVLTHAHEDHIGALPHMLTVAPAPVYGSAFTLAVIEARLAEITGPAVVRNIVEDHGHISVDGFDIEAVPVSHSLPGAVALAIDTPVGMVVHTGDFKVDPKPADGRRVDLKRLRELGDAGVTLLLSDSTNADRQGRTWSEASVADALAEIIGNAKHRVLVTTFSSHVWRIRAVIEAAEAAGRKVAILGRSMTQFVALALEHGLLHTKPDTLIEAEDAGRVPRSQLTIIAAGSQGEPPSSMARIAASTHRSVQLQAGDLAILSARRIPGREQAIGKVVDALCRLGVDVIDDRTAEVHSSGHGFNEECVQMLRACRPRFFIPLHGQYRHLAHHARLAVESNVGQENVFLLESGQPLKLERHSGDTWTAQRCSPVSAGLLYSDGQGSGAVDQVSDRVLAERRLMGEAGLVVCVAIVTGSPKDDARTVAVRLVTRGLLEALAEQPAIEGARRVAQRTLDKSESVGDTNQMAEAVCGALRRFFRRELGRRPLVLAFVTEV